MIQERLEALETVFAAHRLEVSEVERDAFARGVEAGARFHLHVLGIDGTAELASVTAALMEHHGRTQGAEIFAFANPPFKLAS